MCMVYVSHFLLVVSGDRDCFLRLGQANYIPDEAADRIQSPKRRILNKKRTLDNVQKCNNFVKNTPCKTLFVFFRLHRQAADVLLI
jgi:hypothetical protein